MRVPVWFAKVVHSVDKRTRGGNVLGHLASQHNIGGLHIERGNGFGVRAIHHIGLKTVLGCCSYASLVSVNPHEFAGNLMKMTVKPSPRSPLLKTKSCVGETDMHNPLASALSGEPFDAIHDFSTG